MTFDRRAFLRGTVALGFGAGVWGGVGHRLGTALAASSNQKYALLLGLGPEGAGRERLPGCATDSTLLAAALQGRYGFNDDHLLRLGPEQQNLAQLETIFEQFLHQRVQKGDGVVLAFSGYGSFTPPSELPPNPTWEQALPYLALVLSGENGTEILPLPTLVSWLQSLKTKRVYLILDCGFGDRYVKFQGNLRSRSAGALKGLKNENITPTKGNLGNITLISAASPGQTAVEAQLGKRTAGLFTMALCQSLWENNAPSLMPSLWDHSRNLLVPRLGKEQIPQWYASNNGPDFFSADRLQVGGEGLVTAVANDGSLQASFGGVGPLLQKKGLLHSCYQTVASPAEGADRQGTAHLWQVQGVKAEKMNLEPLPRADKGQNPAGDGAPLLGVPVQEMYRALPKSLSLTVALAHDLERIERVDATSAFGAIAVVENVINAGDGPADCVFGPLETHRYSLFTEGGDPLQPLTTSESSGAVKTVVSALEPCLNRLLALKWLTILANGDSTRLGLELNLVQQTSGDNPLPRPIYQWRSGRFTPAGDTPSNNKTATVPNAPPSFLPAVARNQALQCQLENLGTDPLYGCLIGVNNRGVSVAALLQPDLKLLSAKERLTWPSTADPLWLITGDKAIAHWFLIASRFPLPTTLTALGQQFTSNNVSDPPSLNQNNARVLALKNLLPVVLALVEDLSRQGATVAPVPDDMVLLSTADWLSLPIIYQVL